MSSSVSGRKNDNDSCKHPICLLRATEFKVNMSHLKVNKMADSWWGKKLNQTRQISTAECMYVGSSRHTESPFHKKAVCRVPSLVGSPL